MKHIIIAGFGFVGYYAYQELKKLSNTKITIIDKKDHFLFTPLLHETICNTLSIKDVTINVNDV
jgi:NADH dehydrogenase FAD-containing subunit